MFFLSDGLKRADLHITIFMNNLLKANQPEHDFKKKSVFRP